MMDPTLWAKAHGATTHFPVALVVVSAACDAAGFVLAGRPIVRELHAAGYWTILAGAVGAFGAVVSGVVMTKGVLLGHGALRMHHLFVWPAFGLIVALATWRMAVGRRATRPMLGAYLGSAALATALLGAAAYWGGELMLASG